MTWIRFALWLCGLYTIYYLVIILWDAMKNRLPAGAAGTNELTFSEHVPAMAALPEFEESDKGDSVISSGGVSLKQLFNLAREEAIEYIRPVGY
jgi:hypothetical protein